MPEGKCYFCDSECEIYTALLRHLVKDYRCQYCGPYLLNDILVSQYSSYFTAENNFKIACILCERRLNGLSGIAISNKTDKDEMVYTYPQVSVEDVLAAFPTKARDLLNRTLLNLSKLPKRPFELIRLNLTVTGNRLPLFTAETQECHALLTELADQGFIKFNRVKAGLQLDVFSLTSKLWEEVEQSQVIDIAADTNHQDSTQDHANHEQSVGDEMLYDLFISHATEDKDSIVRPLVKGLSELGLRIWYDEFELKIGDSLRQSIDHGLAKSRYGLVVLSRAFFSKNWPQYELDGLVNRQMTGGKVILPIWHEVTRKEVSSYSPSLADKVALETNKSSIEDIIKEIKRVVENSND